MDVVGPYGLCGLLFLVINGVGMDGGDVVGKGSVFVF